MTHTTIRSYYQILYVICRTPRPYDLAQNITALPRQEIGTLFSGGGL